MKSEATLNIMTREHMKLRHSEFKMIFYLRLYPKSRVKVISLDMAEQLNTIQKRLRSLESRGFIKKEKEDEIYYYSEVGK